MMLMRKLRKTTKFYLWLIVAAFIGWIIFDLGANIVGKRNAKPWQKGIIAEVDQHKIPIRYYNQVFQQIYNDSVRANNGVNPSEEEEPKIQQEAWKKILENVRWQKIIEERHLDLTDPTVLKIIETSPPPEILRDTAFRRPDGKFDFQKYIQALRNPRNLPYFEAYERRIRSEVPKDIVKSDILISLPLSHTELFEEYKRVNMRFNAHILNFNIYYIPDSFVKYTDQDLKDYYEKHKEDFYEPEKANLELVILRKLPSPQDSSDAKDRIFTAYDELKSGEKFGDIVQYYSEDPATKDSAGVVGWVKPSDRRYGYLYSIAKKLKKGEFSEPTLTPRGWVIVKLLDTPKKTKKRRKKAKKISEADSLKIAYILVRIRISGTTKSDLNQKMRDFLDKAKEEGFEKAAQDMGLKIVETGEFKLNLGFIPKIGIDNEILKFVKEHEKGEISPVFNKPYYYLVFKIKEKIPKQLPPFDKVKREVELKYKKVKKQEIIDELVNRAESMIKSGLTLKNVADSLKPYGVKYVETGETRWGQPIKTIGINYTLYGAIYAMKPGEVSPPIKYQNGAFIVKLIDKKVPTKQEFEKEKEQFALKMKYGLIDRLWQTWNNELTSEKGVKDYRSYLLY